MDQDGQPATCAGCGSNNELVRHFRGRNVMVPLCDDCAVQRTITDQFGRELRVRAVAIEHYASSFAA